MTIYRHIDFNPPDWGEFGGVAPPADRGHRQAVLADRPLAYWPLVDPSGSTTALDDERGGHHGSVVGSVTLGNTAGPLVHEPGAACDFAGGHIELPTLALFGSVFPSGFTFSCWLKTSSTAPGALASAINPGNSTGWLVMLNQSLDAQESPGRIRCFLRGN